MSDRIVGRLLPFMPDGVSHEVLSASSFESNVSLFRWIQDASVDDVRSTLTLILACSTKQWEEEYSTVSAILVQIIRRLHEEPFSLPADANAQLRTLYAELGSRPALQSLLLRLLIATRQTESLTAFAHLLVEHSALEPRLQVEVFGDLLKYADNRVSAVFPTILKGLQRSGLVSFTLDYANYAYRNKLVDSHPAKVNTKQLISLLSNLADRLGKLQDSRPSSQEEATQLGRQVTEGVALGIALCDTLASIGDAEAVASLNKVVQVEHRRLRVEAAAALAKLGMQDAGKMLVAMAAEPTERLRVLAYAKELDLLDEIDDEFSNIVARAEAEIVMYLAQPSQIGIAPQHIELIDQREQAWPGYEEPRNCFLFQFVYQFPSGDFTNIGIAGPVVMTQDADLTGLSYNDIYALFAGWHVDHPEIYAIDSGHAVGTQHVEMHRLLSSLTDSEDFEDVAPALMGTVLERQVLIASARRENDLGWAMVSDDSFSWISIGDPQRPLGAAEAFHVFVGRSLLTAFN